MYLTFCAFGIVYANGNVMHRNALYKCICLFCLFIEPHEACVPVNDDFLLSYVETKPGEPNAKTGIPPSFFTISCTDFLNYPGKFICCTTLFFVLHHACVYVQMQSMYMCLKDRINKFLSS